MSRATAVFSLVFFLALPCFAQPPMPGLTVFGTVHYPDGTAASNVSVRVEDRSLVRVLWLGETDRQGFYNTRANLKVESGSSLVVSAWSGDLWGVSDVYVEGSVALVDIWLRFTKKVKRHLVNVSGVYGTSACVGENVSVVFELENVGDYDESGLVVYVLEEGVWRTGNASVSFLREGSKMNFSLNFLSPFDVIGVHAFSVFVESRRFKSERSFDFDVLGCETPSTSSSSSTTSTLFQRPSLTTIPYITTLPKSTSTISVFGSCFNEVLDVGEEGVDCGGPCPPCSKEVGAFIFIGLLGVLFFVLFAILYLWYLFGYRGEEGGL